MAEPTPTDAEIGEVMQLVLQCTDARLAWDSDATAESYAAWKASLAAVRDRLARWGAQPAPAASQKPPVDWSKRARELQEAFNDPTLPEHSGIKET